MNLNSKAFDQTKFAVSFFLILSFFSTWFSQSLMDISVSLFFLVCVYHAFTNKIYPRFFQNKSLLVFLSLTFGYFIAAALSLLINGREGSDLSTLFKFSWVFQVIALVWAIPFFNIQLVSEKRWAQIFFYGLLFIVGLVGFNIYFNDGIDIFNDRQSLGRIVGLINSPTYHAHAGGFIFIVLFAYFYFQKTILRPLNILLLFTTICSIFFTYTRGALLALIIALCLLYFIEYRLKHIRYLILFSFTFILLLFTTPLKNMLSRGNSDTCRLRIIQVHLKMIQDKPLLGIGYRDNMRSLIEYWPENEIPVDNCKVLRKEGTQAHNQILNVFATTGLIGLIFYLGLVIYMFFINIKLLLNSPNALFKTSLVLQLYFFMSCMTEVTFDFAKLRYLILIVWAVVIYH